MRSRSTRNGPKNGHESLSWLANGISPSLQPVMHTSRSRWGPRIPWLMESQSKLNRSSMRFERDRSRSTSRRTSSRGFGNVSTVPYTDFEATPDTEFPESGIMGSLVPNSLQSTRQRERRELGDSEHTRVAFLSSLTRFRALRPRTSRSGPSAPGQSRPSRYRRPRRRLLRAIQSSRGSAGPPRRVP